MKSKCEKIEWIIKLYLEDVHKVCLHFTQDEARAKELVKEVFIKFYGNMDWLEAEKGLNLNSKVKSELVLSYLIVLTKKIYIESR